MASNAVNGSAKDQNGSYSKVVTPAAQQSRTPSAPRMSDSKKADDDLSQRRTPQPKAWTSGVNPITQRSNNPQANGAGSRSSNQSYSQNVVQPERNSLDRQILALYNSIGSHCTFVTKAGEGFSGVLVGGQKSGDDYNVLFKMVKSTSSQTDNHQNGEISEASPNTKDKRSMVFSLSSLARLDVPERQNTRAGYGNGGTSGSFRTDADISGGASGSFRTDAAISGNQAMRERNLQRWEAPAANRVDMSLESSASAGGEWDQFKANEQKFGLKSDYDENIYTTRIDRSNPLYAMREREAARIAREIEGDVSSNPHVREERGHGDEALDEEAKYSGVVRNVPDYQPLASSQAGRYVAPARRQQGTNSTKDAFVDPAIISSQVARPGSTKAKPEATAEKSEQKSEARVEPRVEAKAEASKAEPRTQPTSSRSKEGKASKQLGRPGVTENVENEVLDSFRQFMAVEKLKIQDNKRSRASQDKAVRLNDLKKFSKNFKLVTPVPKDLIPILAKDEGKQRQIVENAQRNADASKTSDRTTTGLVDPKSQRLLAAARWEGEGGRLPSDTSKLAKVAAPSAAQPPTGQTTEKDFAATARTMPGLSARLQEGHRLHRAGQAAAAAVPAPLPIRDVSGSTNRAVPSAMVSPQKSATLRGPPSATSAKFNAAAREFRPNPAASTFKPMAPTPVASSPTRSGSVTRSISPAGNPPKFFGDRKSFGKWGERMDPISLVKPKKNEDGTRTGSDGKPAAPLPAQNGGFQYPYRTAPTWVPPPDGENGEPYMKYTEAFDKLRDPNLKNVVSPTQTPPINPSAHQHQLPFHLQNGPHPVPQVHTPQQAPHHVHSPQHHQYPHGHHYDEHHMRPSASNSSHYPAPSPRMQNNNLAYQSPMPPPAQLFGQPVQYVMHPNPGMGARQFSSPQMMPAPGGHLMVQQPSSGGYAPQPMPVHYNQMPMYAGPNGPMYPVPPQPPNGYPSPGRHAPMMVHQGSHQGHQQPIYVPAGQFAQPMYSPQPSGHMPAMRGGFGSPQPHFAQGPYHQQHHFSHQPRRTPSTGYAQPHQVHHHMPSQQGPPQMNGGADMGEDTK